MHSLRRSVALRSWLAVSFLIACGKDGGTIDAPVVVKPVPWTDGVWTQPVPSWGSPVRLNLPVPLASIVLGPTGGLGFFGAHEGGHVEGLNHVWIPTVPGTVINSWAAGTVTRIEILGGSYYITIDYGQGLIGKHQVATRPLVSIGDHVKEGDPVAIAASAEFNLVDNNRTDGERTGGSIGSEVSPFDYLRDDVKAALIARHVNEVVTPFFTAGAEAGNSRPWEPYLTNKMLFHADYPGTIAGEWLCTNKGWTTVDPLYFDVMTIHDVTNAYGHFQHIDLEDYNEALPGTKGLTDGTWQPGDSAGKMVVTMRYSGTKYYARYAVDESGSRARLTIEWKQGSYPASLSSNAAVYVVRSNVYLGLDAQMLGLIK